METLKTPETPKNIDSALGKLENWGEAFSRYKLVDNIRNAPEENTWKCCNKCNQCLEESFAKKWLDFSQALRQTVENPVWVLRNKTEIA